jgi:plasmid stabilization system protein ParE
VSFPVVITPEAAVQVRAISAWWAANRSAAPKLFLDEFAHCLELIGEAPKLGKPYQRHPVLRGLRRALLRSTRYHAYYDAVVILAVWRSQRGQLPEL